MFVDRSGCATRCASNSACGVGLGWITEPATLSWELLVQIDGEPTLTAWGSVGEASFGPVPVDLDGSVVLPLDAPWDVEVDLW